MMRSHSLTVTKSNGFSAPRGALWALLLALPLLLGVTQAHAAADLSFNYTSGALTGPDAFAGFGYHSLALVNGNAAAATFTLAYLKDGTDVAGYEGLNDSLLAAIDSHGDESKVIPDLMKSIDALGGTIVAPSGETDMYADLQAGTYVVAASAVGPNGAAGRKTSYLAFTVSDNGKAAAAAPSTTNSVDFKDFSFDFPAKVPAGDNLWKITNAGSQVHLSTIYKLLPGKTADDLEAFLSPDSAGGPPPFDPSDVVDVEAVSPGQTVYIPLDLSKGDWVAVCFVQDLTPPHLPHFMEGMIEEFAVS